MSARRSMRVIGTLFLIAGSLIIFLYKNYYLIVILLLGRLTLFSLSFYKKKVVNNLTLVNFINVFTHFRVALDSNSNVFVSLNSAVAVTSGAMFENLTILINDMSNDHTIKPFITFAKPFNDRLVTHIMINLFILVTHGLDQKRLWQFNYVFETLINEHAEQQADAHKASYERFDISLFFGTAILIFTLMNTILSLIGEI